jgi:hypothetical protein
MHDSTEKKTLAALVVAIVVAEHLGLLWLFQAADMAERPDPYATDIVSQLGPAHFELYAAILINVVLACALYVYSKRMVAAASERVLWAAIAMALWPWTTALLCFLQLPAFVPWHLILLVGIISPYAVIAARLGQLQNRIT